MVYYQNRRCGQETSRQKRQIEMNRILILDPGSITGWAVYNRTTKELLNSGCIRLYKAPANKLTYLEMELSDIISEYRPDKIYKEKKYEFVRGRKNVHAVMVHATYHATIIKIASECNIPLVEIDTRRWARKKVAQARAREITGRKRISTHASEAIAWGDVICRMEGL